MTKTRQILVFMTCAALTECLSAQSLTKVADHSDSSGLSSGWDSSWLNINGEVASSVSTSASAEVVLTSGVSLASVAPPIFTDESAAAGFFGLNSSWAGSWSDFDNDGDLDVYTIGHRPDVAPSLSQLWQNNGDMTFTDVTVEKALYEQPLDKHGAMWADLDNDGYSDLVIGKTITAGSFNDELWKNTNGETFSNIASSASLDLTNVGRGVYSADYDVDGDLDVLSLGFVIASTGQSNKFFRNDGNMQFTDLTGEIGAIVSGQKNRVASWSDYNNDGLPDVLIMPPCTLYQNLGNGVFMDVTLAAGIQAAEECQSPAWGDYDNDGDTDLYVTSGLPVEGQVTSGFMYQNNGNGTFTDVTSLSGTSNPENARGANWGDYDNDGFLDLYIVNALNEETSNVLFRNEGDGTFFNLTTQAGVGVTVEGGGTDGSFIDYNNDGFLDLFVTNGFNNRLGPYVLLKNATNTNNWLKVKLQGARSNRDGIMTKLKLTANNSDMYREYNGNTHYLSQDSVPVHFGLGQADVVQRIELIWPDGGTQAIDNIAPNQMFTIAEGRSIVRGKAQNLDQTGCYIWRNGQGWNLRCIGDATQRVNFSGQITSNGALTAVNRINLQPNDVVTSTVDSIDFDLFVKRGYDAINFTTTGNTVTFDIYQEGGHQPRSVKIGLHKVLPATLPVTLTE